MRREFFVGVIIAYTIIVAGYVLLPPIYYPIHGVVALVLFALSVLGLYDAFQTEHSIRRNFPIFGHLRYLLEGIRPEINQYFVESNTDGRPFNREKRSIVYQRSKGELDTLPFGTQMDLYEEGYEWVSHSVIAGHVDPASLKVKIGGKSCSQPYEASLLNISAMSYGSLSKNAIQALNKGAKMGGFAHNTGEGSISPYHLEPGGDLIWQIGTGYFGCRTEDGNFDPERFKKRASYPAVKMIELKISQGAKPGHGGILPARKVTKEIATIRDVPVGQTVLSPPSHKTFKTPNEMVKFVQQLRELSGGKPIGIKLCIGKRREFMAMCKAMVETGICPDYIAVDGAEGGTGAAPLEFSNRMGSPTMEGLIFAHNTLKGFGLRDQIKLFAAGKILTGFDIIKALALGADLIYSARGMMMALGCIQALRCNDNSCPTGVATTNPYLTSGLVVKEKARRVCSFHEQTLKAVAEMIGAMGLCRTEDLRPWHILRRVGANDVKHYGEIYPYVDEGDFAKGKVPEYYQRSYEHSRSDTFHASEGFEKPC